jgi:hypothetical protein
MKEPDTQLPPGFWTASQDHGRTAFPDGHAPIFSPERAPHQGHCGFCAVATYLPSFEGICQTPAT